MPRTRTKLPCRLRLPPDVRARRTDGRQEIVGADGETRARQAPEAATPRARPTPGRTFSRPATCAR